MRSISSWLAVALVCGCGGGMAPSDGGIGTDAGVRDAASAPDGNVARDAGMPRPDAGNAPIDGFGSVFAQQFPGGANVGPSFFRATDGTDGCERIFDGPCRLERCTTAPGLTPASAGTIMLTGGLMSVTLPPNLDGTYPALAPPPPMLWNGGESIRITAAGAEVPAFDFTFSAPSQIEVTSPDISALTGIRRDEPFVVTWSGASEGALVVGILQAEGQLKCAFDPAAGTGAIPPAILERLTPGGGSLAIVAEDYRIERVADWSIKFAVRTFAIQDGAQATTALPVL